MVFLSLKRALYNPKFVRRPSHFETAACLGWCG